MRKEVCLNRALLKYYKRAVYGSLKFIFAWFLLHVGSTSKIFLQYDIWTLESPSFPHGCCWDKTVWNYLFLIFEQESQVYFTVAAKYFPGVFL